MPFSTNTQAVLIEVINVSFTATSNQTLPHLTANISSITAYANTNRTNRAMLIILHKRVIWMRSFRIIKEFSIP
uniref:Uncharacterized protein n=1 Tax=Arundo donax TaxID=35708 RepID=A0A0A9E497_ARUDO